MAEGNRSSVNETGACNNNAKCVRTINEKILYQRFLDSKLREERDQVHHRDSVNSRREEVSRQYSGSDDNDDDEDPIGRVAEKTKQMIKQVEKAKASMMDTSGESFHWMGKGGKKVSTCNDLFHAVIADEDYALVGSHVDEITCNKIANSLYVDFGKLIPKDKLRLEEYQRLEIVNRNGQTFFQPMTERDTTNITNLDETAYFYGEKGQPFLNKLFRALFASTYYGLLRVGDLPIGIHPMLCR